MFSLNGTLKKSGSVRRWETNQFIGMAKRQKGDTKVLLIFYSAVYCVHIIENLHFVLRKLFILVFVQNLYAGISRLNFNNSNCASSELSRQF